MGSLGTLEVFPWASLSSLGLSFSSEECQSHLPLAVLSASEQRPRERKEESGTDTCSQPGPCWASHTLANPRGPLVLAPGSDW